MKKMALAIGMTMLTSLANAQSSVQLYGLIDVGIEYLNHAGAGNGNVTRMIGGNMAGSRWGLRGSEDLGGGTSAIFTLEAGFRPGTGASEIGGQSGRLFGRVATIGLQGGFGTVTVGRQAIVLNDVMFYYDPMAFSLYGLATLDGKFFGRVDNSIKYQSPNLHGFSTSAYYTFGSDTVNGQGQVPGDAKVGRAFGFSAQYIVGPLSLAAVYDQAYPTTIALTNAGNVDKRLVVAGSYTIGGVKGFIGYRRLNSTVAGTDGVLANLLWTGLAYQVNPFLRLAGAVYDNEVVGTSAHPTSFVLNADYLLSKRTDVYASVSFVKNRSSGAVSSDAAVTGGADALPPAPGTNQTGAVMGIRHRF
jgi:predicted porin